MDAGCLVWASGERSVAVGGDATGAIIITGDNVSFNLTAEALAQLRQALYSPPQLPSPDDPSPPPSQLPPGSHLLFGRNEAFAGRLDELRVLASDLLFVPSATPTAITQPAAICGSGGMGKPSSPLSFVTVTASFSTASTGYKPTKISTFNRPMRR